MKFIYTVLLFMVFVNIFSFLFIGLGMFPYAVEGGTSAYNLTDADTLSGDSLFENLTDIDFDTITSLSMDNADLIALVAGGIAMAWLMHSPALFGVGLFIGVFLNTFRKSTGIFVSIGANEYIVLAAMIGTIFLIVITIIEYMTQGDV